MNILDKIIVDKKREVGLKKELIPIEQLENSVLFSSRTYSLSKNLRNNTIGIIAEHKRRSPSKLTINNSFAVDDVVVGYQNGGASGISILTDVKYFGGSIDDLIIGRASSNLPLLRKEFIVDEYQIIEAKANGADAILLIAAVLTAQEIKQFSELAQSLALEVLLEVHNIEELEKSIMPSLDMVGVNNRNLKTFEVNIDYSKQLSEKIPNEFVKISESGISNIDTVIELQKYGFEGFLIGENFMKTDNPGTSLKNFINQYIEKSNYGS